MNFVEISSESLIKVTHFISPHSFYFKFDSKEAKKRSCKVLIENERKICDFLDEAGENGDDSIEVGDIVGFYEETWNRFVRGKVLEIRGGSVFVLLLLDFGILQEIQDPGILKKLSKSFDDLESVVYTGCLQLIPAIKIFNPKTIKMEIQEQIDWSDMALEIFSNLIKEAAEIKFLCREVDKNTCIGSLYVKTRSGQVVDLNQVLIDAEQAIIGCLEDSEYLNDSRSETSEKNGIEKVKNWEYIEVNDHSTPDIQENMKYLDDPVKDISSVSSGEVFTDKTAELKNEELKEIVELAKELDLREDQSEKAKSREILPAGIYYRDRIQIVNEYGTGRKFRNRKKQAFGGIHTKSPEVGATEEKPKTESPEYGKAKTENVDLLKNYLKIRRSLKRVSNESSAEKFQEVKSEDNQNIVNWSPLKKVETGDLEGSGSFKFREIKKLQFPEGQFKSFSGIKLKEHQNSKQIKGSNEWKPGKLQYPSDSGSFQGSEQREVQYSEDSFLKNSTNFSQFKESADWKPKKLQNSEDSSKIQVQERKEWIPEKLENSVNSRASKGSEPKNLQNLDNLTPPALPILKKKSPRGIFGKIQKMVQENSANYSNKFMEVPEKEFKDVPKICQGNFKESLVKNSNFKGPGIIPGNFHPNYKGPDAHSEFSNPQNYKIDQDQEENSNIFGLISEEFLAQVNEIVDKSFETQSKTVRGSTKVADRLPESFNPQRRNWNVSDNVRKLPKDSNSQNSSDNVGNSQNLHSKKCLEEQRFCGKLLKKTATENSGILGDRKVSQNLKVSENYEDPENGEYIVKSKEERNLTINSSILVKNPEKILRNQKDLTKISPDVSKLEQSLCHQKNSTNTAAEEVSVASKLLKNPCNPVTYSKIDPQIEKSTNIHQTNVSAASKFLRNPSNSENLKNIAPSSSKSTTEVIQDLKSRFIQKVAESKKKPPKSNQYTNKSEDWKAKESLDDEMEELEEILGDSFRGLDETKKMCVMELIMRKKRQPFQNYQVKSSKKADVLEETPVLKKQEIHRVMVHGPSCLPIEKLSESNFHKIIMDELKRIRITEVYRIQAYSWPNILSCSSVAFVNSRQTGKTFGYLPAICSMVLDSYELEESAEVEGKFGPSVLIICKSSKDVEIIHELICRFTSKSNQKISVVKGFGSQNVLELQCALLNGCDFFVTTAQCFSRLATNKHFDLFNKKKLKSIVIDDLDQISEKCEKDLRMVFRVCCTRDSEENAQIVIASSIWLPIIKKILKLTAAPIICVGNYVEASVIAECRMNLLLMDGEKKFLRFLSHINNQTYKYQKTIVMTRNKEEVHEIYEMLKPYAIPIILIHEESHPNDMEIAHNWTIQKPEFKSIAICSDQGLAASQIKSVQRLIHYSLPDQWTTFSYRFSACFDYYANCLKLEEISDEVRPSSVVFLDENNNQELPRLVEFLESHQSCSISSDIQKLVKNILIERDGSLGNKVPLCQNFLDIGKCSDSFFCKDRHILTKLDESGDDFPKSGMIKFHILEVHSPRKYSVRVKETLENRNEVWKPFRANLHTVEFFLQLGNFFSNPENQIVKHPVNVNDLCAIRIVDEVFRCKILKEIGAKYKSLSTASRFDVSLIDSGAVKRVKSTELWELPENFQKFPATALDIYISDLVPFDRDDSWDQYSTKIVKSWIEEYKQEKHLEFACSVDLSIADKIFVSSIHIVESLYTLNSEIIKESLKKRILHNNLCFSDVQVTDRLIQMSLNSGILAELPKLTNDFDALSKLPHYARPKIQEVERKVAGHWIQLSDTVNYPIIMWDFQNPDNFLVQIEDNSNWKLLARKIEDHVKKDLRLLKVPKTGDYCLIKEIEDFHRGLILDVSPEYGKIKCLWVDSGIQDDCDRNDLFEIPEQIINCLPFQLVCCKLVGILPKQSKNWMEEEVDKMYEKFLTNSDNLFIRAVEEIHDIEKEENSFLNFKKYSVLLIDCTTQEDVIINKCFVDENLAEFDPKTHHFLSLFVCVRETKDENDNENSVESGTSEFSLDTNGVKVLDLSEFELNFPKESLVALYNIPENSEFLKPLEIQEKVEGGKNLEKALEETGWKLEAKKDFEPEAELQELIVEEVGDMKSPERKKEEGGDEIPTLLSSYAAPKIVWQQSESVIKLNIEARDCVDYTFDLYLTSLVIIIKYPTRYERAVINLFGCIDPKFTSHEMTGVTIYVRLVKKVMTTFLWPRLLKSKDNHKWLTYNHDAYAKEKEERKERELLKKMNEFREKYAKTHLKPDNDSDNEYFESLFPHDVDEFDPLEDEFIRP